MNLQQKIDEIIALQYRILDDNDAGRCNVDRQYICQTIDVLENLKSWQPKIKQIEWDDKWLSIAFLDLESDCIQEAFEGAISIVSLASETINGRNYSIMRAAKPDNTHFFYVMYSYQYRDGSFNDMMGKFDTLEEAKIAAQANLENDLLDCLEL